MLGLNWWNFSKIFKISSHLFPKINFINAINSMHHQLKSYLKFFHPKIFVLIKSFSYSTLYNIWQQTSANKHLTNKQTSIFCCQTIFIVKQHFVKQTSGQCSWLNIVLVKQSFRQTNLFKHLLCLSVIFMSKYFSIQTISWWKIHHFHLPHQTNWRTNWWKD